MNLNILALTFCQALLTTGTILLVAVMALIGQKMAPSSELTTLPVAFQFIGLMLATIPASLIMDKVGRKRGFFLGNTIGIVGALICIQALHIESFQWFCLGAFLLGITIGFGTLYRFAVVEMCDSNKRARAISFVMLGGVLAAIAGPNLAIYSQDLVKGTPFVGAFWGLALLYVIALYVLSRVTFPPKTIIHSHEEIRPIQQIINQPIFLVSISAAMISYVVMNLLMTATPLAMHHHGFSFSQSSWVIELHALGMFIPSFFTGRLINRFGTLQMMSLGALVILSCIAINLHGQSQFHFSLALIMLGVGWNFMFITATHLVTSAYSEAEKPKAQAANEFLIFSMVTVSALASGWLESTIGWQMMNLSSIPIVLFAIGLIVYFHKKITLSAVKQT